MSYEDYGSGPIALLIHGSPGNGKAWQRVGERLATRHRVIAPDLPGHGPTTPPPADSAPDPAYAAELIEMLAPILLWIPRIRTWWALLLIALHLGLEMTSTVAMSSASFTGW